MDHTLKTEQSKAIKDPDKAEAETRKLKPQSLNPLEALKGTVIEYDAATSPVADDDWNNA